MLFSLSVNGNNREVKRKLLEENQRLREVCGILGKEKRENEIRQNSRY